MWYIIQLRKTKFLHKVHYLSVHLRWKYSVLHKNLSVVRFQILTRVGIKIMVFCDVTPCGLVHRDQCFGKTCCSHPLFREPTIYFRELCTRVEEWPWKWRRQIPLKHGTYLPKYITSYLDLLVVQKILRERQTQKDILILSTCLSLQNKRQKIFQKTEWELL
jgi:hypothetical protein